MITITFGAVALMLAATASLSACLGLMIGMPDTSRLGQAQGKSGPCKGEWSIPNGKRRN